MLKIILISLALSLSACQPSSPTGVVYNMTSKSTWNTKTIEMHWMNEKQVNDTCIQYGTTSGGTGAGIGYEACARTKPSDPSICEIYAVQPSNFEDTKNLSTIGHELWHCMGAKHD
jgi:hypothetical protein